MFVTVPVNQEKTVYSKVSIKRHVLLNILSIKRPVPSQKKSIVLFYLFTWLLSLLNVLVWIVWNM